MYIVLTGTYIKHWNKFIYILCIFFSLVVESMSKSAFLDMLKSSSDKARTQEINKEEKTKVIAIFI